MEIPSKEIEALEQAWHVLDKQFTEAEVFSKQYLSNYLASLKRIIVVFKHREEEIIRDLELLESESNISDIDCESLISET